jgi:thiol-disulfide isomerase/thioredoxin
MNLTKVILIAGATIVLLALLGMIKTGSEGFVPGFGTAGASPVGSFVMYYADWCPHCKSVKPDFQDFAKSGIVTVNGRNVAVSMVEESEKEKMAGKPIKGFPTFLFESADGQTVEYSGPRTRDSWMDFLAEQTANPK